MIKPDKDGAKRKKRIVYKKMILRSKEEMEKMIRMIWVNDDNDNDKKKREERVIMMLRTKEKIKRTKRMIMLIRK